MSGPLVAVTCGAAPDSRGFERASLNLSYLRALEAAGAIPLMIAPGVRGDSVREAVRRCGGLVLTGGGDIAPARYGQEPHERTAGVSDDRDAMELAAIEAAEAEGLPILAICRGMQVLNVARGGSLVQDIPSMVKGALDHSLQEPRHGPAHAVEIAAGSRLERITGAGRIGVNSRHHQALGRIGAGLAVTARAPDGVVEAVEVPGGRFVVGVQWHPEDMAGQGQIGVSAARLFAAFVAAASEACR
jgi:putative glutamine amidotransferase